MDSNIVSFKVQNSSYMSEHFSRGASISSLSKVVFPEERVVQSKGNRYKPVVAMKFKSQ